MYKNCSIYLFNCLIGFIYGFAVSSLEKTINKIELGFGIILGINCLSVMFLQFLEYFQDFLDLDKLDDFLVDVLVIESIDIGN